MISLLREENWHGYSMENSFYPSTSTNSYVFTLSLRWPSDKSKELIIIILWPMNLERSKMWSQLARANSKLSMPCGCVEVWRNGSGTGDGKWWC